MATDLGRAKSVAANKYDAIVASQLSQAEKRIRFLDLTAGLLGFVALALIYAVVLVLCDSKLMLAEHSRQLALYFFLAGSAVYLFFAVVRPLRWRVNPYYAARQLEQQLPHAKNSIVNWVDLHDQPLPSAIRGALGQRAAKDSSRVDLEQAISGRRAAWMGGLAGLGVLAFVVVFFLVGPAPFLSLLRRAFNPFGQVGVSTRTQLTLLKPEGGNTTVTLGRGVNLVVEVHGKIPNPKAPDALKLLYRYDTSEPWLERQLIQEPSREWTTSLSAIEVRNGLWYRITGGDASTEEYRVEVRAAAAITDFLATYHFRPYVARADEVRRQRELQALRGTEVELRIRTNRTLREGWLEFVGKSGAKSERGVVDPAEPHTLLVHYLLDEDGKYHLHFTPTEGEAYSDSVSYPVKALPDNPPTVELTKPGNDIRLPADALLHLEGKASDDIGVNSLELHMRVVGGERLLSQRYRSDDELRLPEGGYPRELDYKDYVELSRVKNQENQPVSLHAGMELEYWLEARDACDYPHANITQSKHYRVVLTEPEKKEQERQQEKQQAQKEKKQHEQKQDQKLQQEGKERQEQRQSQEAQNKEEQNKSNESGKNAGNEQSSTKQNEQGNNSGKKENGEQSGENKSNEQGEKNGGLSPEDQKTEEKVKKALENQADKQGDKGESKPDAGANNGAGQNNSPAEKSQGKDKGANQSGAEKAGEGKSKPEQLPQPGESKSSGNTQQSKQAGQDKPQPTGQGAKTADGDSKADKSKGREDKRQATNKKDKGDNRHSEPKEEGERKDNNKSEGKQGDSTSKGKQSSSQAKPSTGNKNDKQDAKSESKPDARDATAKDIEEMARKLESKDPQEREAAKRQLQKIKQEAADPQCREQAGEALKKNGQSDGAADTASPKKGNDRKDDKGNAGSAGTPGAEPRNGTQPGQKNGQNGKDKKDGNDKSDADGTQPSSGGNRPGGGDRRSGDSNLPEHGDATPHQQKPATPDAHRAAQMQLEDFAKRVNKDILKKAGVSEDAWQKYLQAKSKQLQPRSTPRPESPNAPQQANTLPSVRSNTIQSTPSDQSDTGSADRGQAPPGYRDAYRKLSRRATTKDK